MTLPGFVAHADWGTDPKKRQVASAKRTSGGGYIVYSLAPADPIAVAKGDLRAGLHVDGTEGQLIAGFDFPIGLPRAYAEVAGIPYFPDFLAMIGNEPWNRFYDVAVTADDISIHRPFYPMCPGGTSKSNLYDGLGMTRDQLRRRCEGNDAETTFWTLGGKQVGKAALSGWRYLAAAPIGSIRLWPFEGPLADLLDGGVDVVTETYPREFYRHIKPEAVVAPGPWSKRRRADRLLWVPRVLGCAASMGVEWGKDALQRVEAGFSAGSNGEDEFDAVVGLLGMIVVVTGVLGSGEPNDDSGVVMVEGWILGRSSGEVREDLSCGK